VRAVLDTAVGAELAARFAMLAGDSVRASRHQTFTCLPSKSSG
jgi:hypothetical protein